MHKEWKDKEVRGDFALIHNEIINVIMIIQKAKATRNMESWRKEELKKWRELLIKESFFLFSNAYLSRASSPTRLLRTC